MNTVLFIPIALMFFAGAQAQLAATPQPVQMQSQPCSTSAPATGGSSTSSGSGYPDQLQKKYDDKAKKLGIPTKADLEKYTKAKANPCPPKPASPPAPAAAAPQPTPVKLPPDTSVTLHCNPLTPSPQGGSRQTTLTLPDPKDFAVPKASDWLMDGVVPDTAAKTPCYVVKVDPKTGKSFVQQ